MIMARQFDPWIQKRHFWKNNHFLWDKEKNDNLLIRICSLNTVDFINSNLPYPSSS